MTDAAIAKLKLRKKRYAVRVSRGLQLVVHPSGSRSWIFRYHLGGQSRSRRIGTFPNMKFNKARKIASEWSKLIEEGADPAVVHGKRPTVTAKEFGARWVKEVVDEARKDPKAVTRYLDRHVYPKFGKRTMASITPWEVQALIFAKRDAGKPEAAAALRHLLKRLFDYAKGCGVIASNPVELTPLRYVTQHKSRDRFLSEAELKLFLQQLPALGRLGVILELMLLTMCRKSELRLARWEHINFEKAIWELPASLSKTSQAHIFYLSSQALALFRRLKEMGGRAEVVLPMRDSIREPMRPETLNHAMARVKWGIAHFTPHDLRRTATTHVAEMGHKKAVIEKALNHGVDGVHGVYNRAEYREERIKMLQAWGDYVEGLKDG